MAIGSLIALALGSIGSAVLGSLISHHDNERNIDFQTKTNQQNLDFQREVNAQNQYNMEHAHQIEMKDLQAAGINPVLTATGGSGAPLAQQNAATMKAPSSDLSGVGSAISSALNSLTMLTMASSMAKNQDNMNSARIAAQRENELLRLGGKNALLDKSLASKQQIEDMRNLGKSTRLERAIAARALENAKYHTPVPQPEKPKKIRSRRKFKEHPISDEEWFEIFE